VNTLEVHVNTGNAAANGTVVDFASTYERTPGAGGGKLSVAIGGQNPTSLDIGYARKVVEVRRMSRFPSTITFISAEVLHSNPAPRRPLRSVAARPRSRYR